MKRLLAILMLLVLGFPVASPLFALSNTAENKLPSCCRRNGAHHCTSPDIFGGTPAGTVLTAGVSHCDQYPAALPAAASVDLFFVHQTLLHLGLASASAVFTATSFVPPSTDDRSGQTRGPPAALPVSL